MYNATTDLLDRHLAEGRGARIAYRHERGTTTYAELAQRVDAAGQALRALGLEPEQRVLLLLQDTIDFPAVFLGAMKLGAVPVPVSTMLKPADYAFLLEDSRARVAVVSEALLPLFEAAARPASLHEIVVSGASDRHARLDDLVRR